MEFSIMFPTRGRIQSVKRTLDSIQNTTHHKDKIEVLIAIDNDDLHAQTDVPRVIQQFPTLNIKHYSRERSEFLNRDYYNWMAEKTTGNYLWAIGDDVVFLEKGWDIVILKQLEDYLKDKPDRIMCAGIKDDTPKPKPSLPQFPCFPLITKESFKEVGFLLHPNIPTWGADYLIYLLYSGARRYLAIRDRMYLAHISCHTKCVPRDATAKNIEAIFNRLKMNQNYNVDITAEKIVPKQVDKLNAYLSKFGVQ